MLALKDKTTYGFDISYEKQADGQNSFTVTPSSFLIRMAIAPLRVVFDATTKAPLRYEGRVPPMKMVAGKLEHENGARKPKTKKREKTGSRKNGVRKNGVRSFIVMFRQS